MTQALYSDHFALPATQYQRDVDVLKHYVQDVTKYLQVQTGKSEQECRNFVTSNLKAGGQFAFKDPKVVYLDRVENGDREKKETTLSRYIRESLQTRELIAPTFTTYLHPDVEKSLLSVYIEENIAKRGKAKKMMFAAKAAGDRVLSDVKKIEQTGRKLANNAISGAHVSASTPLYNKTAHSTLTSTCRSTSGYGNANNEKFLSGNRHYFNHHIVTNNIVAIVNATDFTALESIVRKYDLHYPTVDEVMQCITYSSSMYWWEQKYVDGIRVLIEKLNPLERAAFVYTGDAYHLMKLNPEMMRTFLTRLSDKIEGVHPDPMKTCKKAPDSYISLAHQICFRETAGIGVDHSKIEGTPKIHTLALTLDNIAHTVLDYSDLIKVLWMPKTLPASVAHFPESIRRSAVTSDTDSTIFTVQDWIFWYTGKLSFDDRSKGVYAAVVFLAASTITHVLATMSANMGIIPDHMFKIAMKSEFTFDVFVNTSIGKHYFAAISCQEGNVFEKFEYEIKGVGLKSANSPRKIIKTANEMMKGIIHDVVEKGSISLYKYLAIVADSEREIEASIRAGNLEYLRSGSVKDAASYTQSAENSPYQNHFFWNEVFGPKYGTMPEPPYETAKISVSTDSSTKLKAWIDSIEDKQLAQRLQAYIVRTGKNGITTFNLPKEILNSKGIPAEITMVIDFRKIKTDICSIFYIILESLGYYAQGDKVNKLVSENGF